MKNPAISLVAVVVVCLSAGAALAGDYTYSGSLYGPSGGLDVTGEWGPVNLSWTVTGDAGGAWHYAYTLNTTKKAVSHFLLEASSTFTSGNIWAFTGPIEIETWDPGPGNPEMPDSLYGIKFDWGGSTNVTYSFDSNRVPMWGDFYAKDGTGNYVWNSGFADTDPVDPPTNGSLRDHILVPDTITDVPEPGSLVLGLMALGASLGGVIRRRRAAKR